MRLPALSLYQSLPHFEREDQLAFRKELRAKSRQFIKARPEFGDTLTALNSNLKKAIIDSAFPDAMQSRIEPTTIKTIEATLEPFRGAEKRLTVGLWDLDTSVGELPLLVTELTEAQTEFAFFHIHAAVPASLLAPLPVPSQEGSDLESDPLANNILFDRFFPIAQKVRKEFGLDYIVGISRRMIAFTEDDGRLRRNFFSVDDEAEIIISSFNLQEYATNADIPFRAAIGSLIIGQLLCVVNEGLVFHDETRNCIFDYDEQRDAIVGSLRDLKICNECLSLLKPPHREIASKFVQALRLMGK